MRVLLSRYASRGEVEQIVGLALPLRALGTDVPVCPPPDFTELRARVGGPLTRVGRPVRTLPTGSLPPPGGACR